MLEWSKFIVDLALPWKFIASIENQKLVLGVVNILFSSWVPLEHFGSQ